jgi:DNA-binding MltR family transcriptional regulator
MTPVEILTRKALDELQASSDRAIAIVGAVLIDNGLRALLSTRLRTDQAVDNELFQPTGPLGALGPKARLAYMLSLIDKAGYDDIILVEGIRNKFAHRLECDNFDHAMVIKLIKKFSMNNMSSAALSLTDNTEAPSRSLFLMALYYIIDRVVADPPLEPATIILRPT